jgi:hypothetical protein
MCSCFPLWLSRRPSIAAFHTAIQPLSAAPTIPELVSSQGIIRHAPQSFQGTDTVDLFNNFLGTHKLCGVIEPPTWGGGKVAITMVIIPAGM